MTMLRHQESHPALPLSNSRKAIYLLPALYNHLSFSDTHEAMIRFADVFISHNLYSASSGYVLVSHSPISRLHLLTKTSHTGKRYVVP